MEELKLSDYYNDGHRAYRANMLKFLLMPFVFFAILGFPTRYGGYVSTLSNFAAPSFFILCGFFNLPPQSDFRLYKIKKAVKRSGVFFAIMLLSYITINILYLAFCNSLYSGLFAEFFNKRVLFNFLVLNIWVPFPMGSAIWFIQSLFYAYVFFLLAEKLKLAKLYTPILIILLIFMLATGEFAAFLKFPHFGYNYIPAGALTRAIPYMIIGMIIRKHIDKISSVKRFLYAILFFVGLIMAVAEFQILHYFGKLVYQGHAIGFGVMAFSVCCFALVKPVALKENFFVSHGRNYSRRLYAFCQPVALAVYIIGPLLYPPFILFFYQYSSIISFIICFTFALTIGMIKHTVVFDIFKENKKYEK